MYIRGKCARGDLSYYRPAEQDDTYIKTVSELPSGYLLLLPLLTSKEKK
jgi:hypothetical protein